MRKVLSYLKPYRKLAFFALSLMLVELAVELCHPLFMAKIIDDGILEQDFAVVIKWGAAMLGISLAAFIAGIVNSFCAAQVSQSYGYDVRMHLFEKVQSFSFTNLNQFPTSSLITRMTNDVTQVQNIVFMGMRIALRAPLLIVGGMIAAFFVNVKLALILLITSPFLLFFMFWMMNKAKSLFQLVQARLDRVNSVMRENLSGIRLVKAFFRWQHEVQRFTKANEDLKRRTVTALRVVETAMPVLLLIMNGSIVFILWFGSIEATTGGAQVGEVVAIVNYATRITFAFSALSFIIMGFSQARASAHRISEVLDTDVDLVDADDADPNIQVTEGRVVFDAVSFQYPNTNVPVLKTISFTIHPGEMVAILGATGSGKSSLFQLIPRLYDVDEGGIFVDHHDIRTMQLEQLRNQIGFVPQEALLFTGTVKENITWGKDEATMEDVIAAAKDAQIHDTILKLPQQYDTMIGQRGVNLSGGQKQRISIARALIRRPKLLLLDDCTSALDLKTEAKLLQALKRYPCTTFIITQKISTVMESDSILLLDEGKLLDTGDHDTLLQTSFLYQKIFESQFGEEKLHEVKAVK